MMSTITMWRDDCLNRLQDISDASVDMVLTDPPYNTVNCEWDVKIPISDLFGELWRVTKPTAALCVFSQMPFAVDLVNAARKFYRYQWVVEKAESVGFLNANRMPLRSHECVQVFYRRLPKYHPQFTVGTSYTRRHNDTYTGVYKKSGVYTGTAVNNGLRYPRDVQKVQWRDGSHYHPTQKPVSFCEYLIKTYTDVGETVLDCFMGGGSTGEACVKTHRNFIGIEIDEKYFNIAKERIESAKGRV